MQKKIKVAEVDRLDGDVIIVAFSDGTAREYKAETLHALPEEDDAAIPEAQAGA